MSIPQHQEHLFPQPAKIAGLLENLEPYRVAGRLALRFERASGHARTTVSVEEQHPPLQVVRSFNLEDGGALVHLHNLSGGVLGGDSLRVAIEVGPGAVAQVTSTGATRVYRSRAGAEAAVQQTEVRVGEAALLEYLPDALIPFAGSRYRQETRVELADGGGLVWWETVAPGREARGEIFEYDALELRLDVEAGGVPLAIESARIEPRRRTVASLVRLGPFRYFATLYVCRVGEPARRWAQLETGLAQVAEQRTHPGEVLWGVSTLAAHGVVVRGVSVAGYEMTSGLLAFWQAAKREIWGREAVPPRKIH